MNLSTRTLWGLTATAYFVGTTLAHLEFSLWLVAPRSLQWQGRMVDYTLRDLMPYLLPFIALAWLLWMAQQARRHWNARRAVVVIAYWLLWLACVAAVDRWLTYSVAEYFHYPQYAILIILLARAMDPEHTRWPIARLLITTTLLGALDELAQYMWITTRYSHYYDFNDVLVNMLAGVLGVMLYYGFRVPPEIVDLSLHKRRIDAASVGVLIALALIVGAAFASGRLALTPPSPVPPGGLLQSTSGQTTLYLQRAANLYGTWLPGPWRSRYLVMGADQGLVLVVAFGFSWIVWGLRTQRRSRDRGKFTKEPF